MLPSLAVEVAGTLPGRVASGPTERNIWDGEPESLFGRPLASLNWDGPVGQARIGVCYHKP